MSEQTAIGIQCFTVEDFYIIIVKNPDGTEGVCGYVTPEGGIAPFFIETFKKMPSFRGMAQRFADMVGEAKIVRFTTREDVEVLKKSINQPKEIL